MTELLSLSPYAYLSGLSPSERQAEIYRRQHRANHDAERDEFTGSVIDTARRARDLQAELADYESLSEMVTGTSREPFSREIVGITIWDKETKTSVSFGPMYKHRSDELLAKCDSLRTMCAELIEALNVAEELAKDYAWTRQKDIAFTPNLDDDRQWSCYGSSHPVMRFRRHRATLTRARNLLEGGE